MTDREEIEAAFREVRAELGIRSVFPEEVERAAEAAARSGGVGEDAPRAERTALPLVTIDPPGSRDLDQALHIEPLGEGYRVHYAIADVARFVERGGAIEREAWQRGVTFYAPDERVPLYPPVLSQGAASLLPGEERPAILFALDVDARGALAGVAVERARVRSRAQLTYAQVAEHVAGGGALFRGEEWAATLERLRAVGELRMRRERARGGVSLPILDQHVQQEAALRLGYELVYEEPNEAEEWNAQISLLTGHAAALRMLRAGVGLLRTVAPAPARDVERFRRVAATLGFAWPDGLSYAGFMHSLDPAAPHLETLVWQARRLTHGADYIPFDGAPPPQPDHAALAMPYAHCTAPLRRLADRYVLDLLVRLERGERPSPTERETLVRVAAVMREAARKEGRLERRAVDVAEAWTLRGRVGEFFPAVVLDTSPGRVEVQLPEPPVRARIPVRNGASALPLGSRVRVRLARAEVREGCVEFELAAG